MWDAGKWSWTPAQRRALIALVALAASCLAVEAYLRPAYVGEVLPAVSPRAGELADRIDPNTASAEELSTIPQLGAARARALIAYRQSYAAAHPGRAAFERAEDLRNIKGIGPATIEKLAPYMAFDATTTRASP